MFRRYTRKEVHRKKEKMKASILLQLLAAAIMLSMVVANPHTGHFQCSNKSEVNISQLFALRHHRTRKLENVQMVAKEINRAESLLNSSIEEMEKVEVDIEEMTVSGKMENECADSIPRDCCEIKQKVPSAESGMYTIRDPCSGDKVFSAARLTVYCDMETDGGGWIVIQRRNASMGWVKFNTEWYNYENGFGDMDGEFWIGLKNIFELTQRENMRLQLLVWNHSGNTIKSTYSHFRISGAPRYALAVLSGHSGTSGYLAPFYISPSTSYYFQTYDYYAGQTNCPLQRQNGWWYYYRLVNSRTRAYDSNCAEYSNLNGLYQPSGLRGTSPSGERLHWRTTTSTYPTFTNAEMKIRPQSCTLN